MSSLIANCVFIRPMTFSALRDPARVVADLIEVPLGDAVRRDDAGAVAGVDAGLLDVLHDAADDHRAGRVGDAVDVELDGVLEELVDEHRPLGRRLHGRRHVAVERGHVVDDGHGAAAEHVRRPDDQREPDLERDLARFFRRGGDAARRLRDAEVPQQLREPLAILGEVDRIGRGAEDLDARLPAAAAPASAASARRTARRPTTSPPPSLLARDDREHVLEGQRLEVEAIDGVVVGRDGLRVAVDHHRLEPVVAQRERGVHAAVVELDALPDAVRAAAEDDRPSAAASDRPRTPSRRCRRDTA